MNVVFWHLNASTDDGGPVRLLLHRHKQLTVASLRCLWRGRVFGQGNGRVEPPEAQNDVLPVDDLVEVGPEGADRVRHAVKPDERVPGVLHALGVANVDALGRREHLLHGKHGDRVGQVADEQGHRIDFFRLHLTGERSNKTGTCAALG